MASLLRPLLSAPPTPPPPPPPANVLHALHPLLTLFLLHSYHIISLPSTPTPSLPTSPPTLPPHLLPCLTLVLLISLDKNRQSLLSLLLTALTLRGLLPVITTLTRSYSDDTLLNLLIITNSLDYATQHAGFRFATLTLLSSRCSTSEDVANTICVSLVLSRVPVNIYSFFVMTTTFIVANVSIKSYYLIILAAVCSSFVLGVRAFEQIYSTKKVIRPGRWDIARVDTADKF